VDRVCRCAAPRSRRDGRSPPQSSRSVLASCPAARANSRTWRGLTTAATSPASLSASRNARSYPPVASSTMPLTRSDRSRPINPA
jgi:hypothetical protein